MTSLRFGSFEPASAPPRLWSDRLDSDDVFEHSLPLLEFEGAGGSLAGCLVRASSARTLVGVGDEEPVVASISLASPVVDDPDMTTVAEVGRGGGGSGQVASTSLFPVPTSASPVTVGSADAGRGGPRQAASTLSLPVVAAAPTPSVALGEGGLGQVALAPPSSSAVRRTASPPVVAAAPALSEALGEGGLGQVALAPPSSPAVRRTASPATTTPRSTPTGGAGGGLGQAAPAILSPNVPVAMGLGMGHLSEGFGSPQPPPSVTLVDPLRDSARGFTREEVVAFGGIPDPASTGRWMSARIQELPEVDDMQQRCAMRAAKLHDAEISTENMW
nr:spidroin-2 isoform X3 [Aegilops tauschii subsp. strangulata]